AHARARLSPHVLDVAAIARRPLHGFLLSDPHLGFRLLLLIRTPCNWKTSLPRLATPRGCSAISLDGIGPPTARSASGDPAELPHTPSAAGAVRAPASGRESRAAPQSATRA